MFRKKEDWMLRLHLMPERGWLNDPNGLCFFQGYYHVFFQYSPQDVNGGLKNWGHYRSKDMIHWEDLGVAIHAEESYEKDGVYSGCAIEEQGVLHIFYTGNVKRKGTYDYITSGREANVVHAICKDGIHIEKKTCVLTNQNYPKNYSLHVRDPKVWKVGQRYFMVLGGRTLNHVGNVLLYQSNDLEHWDWIQAVESKEEFGYMWECPDFFTVNGVQLLSISPQGIASETFQYQNIYQSGYFFVRGKVDEDYQLSNFEEWDRGFDFYAPQTFEDYKGRRILIGWMGLPDAPYENPTVEHGWQHALTMPRELSIKHGIVYQQPILELEELQREPKPLGNQELIHVDIARIEVENLLRSNCHITIAEGLHLRYDKENAYISLEFTNDIGCGRTKRKAKLHQLDLINIYIDTSAVEIYINGGVMVFSTRYYPNSNNQSVVVECQGSRNTIWNMDGLVIQTTNGDYNKKLENKKGGIDYESI